MNSDIFTGYEKVNVKVLTLTSLSSKKGIDIIPLARNIEIYCSIFSPVITGSVKIIDTSGVTQNLPIVGEEVLEIIFQSPNRKEFNKTCFVYAIEQQEYNDNGAAISFILKFATIDHYKAITMSLNQGAKQNISTFIRDILKNNLTTTNNLNIEETKGLERIILLNWNIWECIEFLRAKAVSLEYSSPFVFFEDQDGYNFVSYEKLIEQREAKAEELVFTQDAFKPGAGDDQGQNTVLAKQYRNASQFEVISKNNTVTRVQEAGMSSASCLFDPFTKTIKINQYNYNDLKDIIKKPLASKFYPSHSSAFANTMTSATVNTLYIVNEHDENYLSQEIIGAKQLFINALKGMCIGFTTNGDSQLQAGDIITLLAPKRTNNPVNDKQITGKYIIGNIKHSILDGAMYTIIESYKFGYNEQIIEEPAEEILTQIPDTTLNELTTPILGVTELNMQTENIGTLLSTVQSQITTINTNINNISTNINQQVNTVRERIDTITTNILTIKDTVLTQYRSIFNNIENIQNIGQKFTVSKVLQLLKNTNITSNNALLENMQNLINATTLIGDNKSLDINSLQSIFSTIETELNNIKATNTPYNENIENINTNITALHNMTTNIRNNYNKLLITKNKIERILDNY